jgi:hypothetical protein
MIPVRVRNATQGNPREEVGGESASARKSASILIIWNKGWLPLLAEH